MSSRRNYKVAAIRKSTFKKNEKRRFDSLEADTLNPEVSFEGHGDIVVTIGLHALTFGRYFVERAMALEPVVVTEHNPAQISIGGFAEGSVESSFDIYYRDGECCKEALREQHVVVEGGRAK